MMVENINNRQIYEEELKGHRRVERHGRKCHEKSDFGGLPLID